MAQQFGYQQSFSDNAGMWDVDGYAVCTDGYGTLVIQTLRISPNTGTPTVAQSASPASAVHDITESGNSTGLYKIHLNETWCQLHEASIETVIPSGQSVPDLRIQHTADTVGNASYGPGESELQYIQFRTVVPSTGTNGVLDQGSGLRFRLRLRNTSF